MIGFNMKARGSNGFKRDSGAWTEGSMIALQIAMSVPKVNVPGSAKGNRGIIQAIEGQFGKIARTLFDQACGSGQNFTLFVTGDVSFKYFVDYSKSADEIKSDILRLYAAQDDEMGDQVLIHFSQAINQFQLHNITNNPGDSGFTLTIDIDL